MFALNMLTGNASGKRSRGNTGRERGQTLFLADYLTAFCDAGALVLADFNAGEALKKNLGTNVYKLTGPHRLWFTVAWRGYCAGLARHTLNVRKVSSLRRFLGRGAAGGMCIRLRHC